MKEIITNTIANTLEWFFRNFPPIIFIVAIIVMLFFGVREIISISNESHAMHNKCNMSCGQYKVLTCKEQIHEGKKVIFTVCGNDSIHRTEIEK